MNNNIKESYCSREVMNLLLKHGFNVVCDTPIPTHSIAIEWIRVNFNKKIEEYWFTMGANEYAFRVIDEYEEKEIYDSFNAAGGSYIGGYPTPQEATEAALLFTLENLIS